MTGLKRDVKIRQKGKREKVKQLSVKGEESISGSTPLPSSDDNALEAAQKVGLYSEASESQPARLGVGREINEAERKLRTTRTTGRNKK